MHCLEDIAKNQKITMLQLDNNFWGYVIPLIFKLQREGASFFIKVDGERCSSIFTIMIAGGPLQDDYYRIETDDLQLGLTKVLSDYAQKFWC